MAAPIFYIEEKVSEGFIESLNKMSSATFF